jgi:uncharacterized RDD family membrane protein YckC
MASVPTSGSVPPPPPVWDARPTGTPAVAYGGFWIRVVAYIIDAVVLGIASSVLFGLFGISLVPTDFSNYDLPQSFVWINLAWVAVVWLYFALLESAPRGATIGKMALGLRVVTGDGQQLSFLNATGRYFAKILSGMFFCIGYMMVGWTERKRGLHDMIANTVVIKVR